MKRLTKFKNVLLTILVLCFVACDPEDEPERNHSGSTETPFNATNLSLEEINNILIGTWVDVPGFTSQGDTVYANTYCDTVTFLESGVIKEGYPNWLRNHDGWNYNLTRDSIFTAIDGTAFNLYEAFDGFINISCFMEVNTGDPYGEYYKDHYVYVLILYKEDSEYYLIIPGWHPNTRLIITPYDFYVKFKKVK